MSWQPIETCPEYATVLLYQPAVQITPKYTEGPFMVVCRTYRRIGQELQWDMKHVSGAEAECDMDKPTHWLPLPEPPKP